MGAGDSNVPEKREETIAPDRRESKMNDSDQSSAAASGPHRKPGDNPAERGLWDRFRTLLTSRSATLRENLAEALEGEGEVHKGALSANERAMLQNVLKLAETRVSDVMVPRADIEAVEASESMADLIATFRSAGHSRLPVYDESLDRIIGFVHIKDALQRLTRLNGDDQRGSAGNGAHSTRTPAIKLLSTVLKQRIDTGKDLVRKVMYVPPSMPAGDLLQQMQATRVHMAIVVDEYGGTDGLVTIEDLLEAVVGNIEDEHDEDDEQLLRKIDDNTYIADARVELTALQEALGPDFQPGEHGDDVDTLGGLLFDLVDRVPVRGEVISRLKGFEFEVLAADARRIRRVRIIRRKRPVRALRAKGLPDKPEGQPEKPEGPPQKPEGQA